jgi:hypothetical protein
LAESLYAQVEAKTTMVLKNARFFSVTCDKVTTLDTQSWISIHGYVCQDWQRLPMLLSLEQVVEGGTANHLTKTIAEVVKKARGFDKKDIAGKFMSFGVGKSFSLLCFVSLPFLTFIKKIWPF